MLLNCHVGEDSWEFLGLQEDPISLSKGNQSWIFIGRMMLKLKLQYFGHLMQRTDSLEKTLLLGKIEGNEKEMTEDEMVGWHHQLDGHELEQAPGVGDGQGSLVCNSPWGRKELDTTEQLNWTVAPSKNKGKHSLTPQDSHRLSWINLEFIIKNENMAQGNAPPWGRFSKKNKQRI